VCAKQAWSLRLDPASALVTVKSLLPISPSSYPTHKHRLCLLYTCRLLLALCSTEDPTSTAGRLLKLQSNGTVSVSNKCQISGRTIDIRGEATPADPAYGSKGVLRVQFPGTPPPDCPGPNYIVQGELGWMYPSAEGSWVSGFLLGNEGRRVAYTPVYIGGRPSFQGCKQDTTGYGFGWLVLSPIP
jgi:hypothetical protein